MTAGSRLCDGPTPSRSWRAAAAQMLARVKRRSYANQICFPLPDVERNNNPTLNGKSS